MTNTHQSPTPLSYRLTPEESSMTALPVTDEAAVPFADRITPAVREDWAEYEAANARAAKRYKRHLYYLEHVQACSSCGVRTERVSGACKKCEAAA